MATSPDVAIAALQATSRSARCHNAFFRQEQLKSLHDALRNNALAIRDAILQDTEVTDAVASIEATFALKIVKEHYASINQKKELEREYRIAKGHDAIDRTDPWGVVYIEPQLRHTPFLSIMSPLSAALASGNCVVLKLENTPRALPSLMRSLLSQALESDTFQIVSSSPSETALLECLSVLQDTQLDRPTHSQLLSSKGRVVAVVDRTADLSSAAEALVTARFSFKGTSPYAPDIILVNEFAKREFLEHVLKHAIPFMATTPSILPNGTPNTSRSSKTSKLPEALTSIEDNEQWNSNAVTRGDAGAIVELTRTTAIHVPLPKKLSAPILCISAISSLDDAIDLIAGDSDLPLAAAYHFATPAHAKYLAQFVKSDISFVNHIPLSLLLGPAAPLFKEIDYENKYIKQHFVRDSPVHTIPVHGAAQVNLASRSSRDASRLLEEAATEIQERKRAEWIAIGFFEQGILIGLGVYGVPILACLGASLFFGVRAGLRKFTVPYS